jgi:hypothetical protein
MKLATGLELMQELVMQSFGAPLSTNFLRSYLAVAAERVRRIGRSQDFHPEVLTEGYQVEMKTF